MERDGTAPRGKGPRSEDRNPRASAAATPGRGDILGEAVTSGGGVRAPRPEFPMFERGSPRGTVTSADGVAHKRTAAGWRTRRRGGVRGRLRCGIRATPRFGPGSVVAHRRSAGRGDECLRSGGRSLRGWNSVRRYQDRVQPAVPTRAVPPTAEASVMTKTMTARGPRVGLDLQASRTNGPVRCRADGARTLDRPITIRLAQISAEAIALRH